MLRTTNLICLWSYTNRPLKQRDKFDCYSNHKDPLHRLQNVDLLRGSDGIHCNLRHKHYRIYDPVRNDLIRIRCSWHHKRCHRCDQELRVRLYIRYILHHKKYCLRIFFVGFQRCSDCIFCVWHENYACYMYAPELVYRKRCG